MPSFFDEFIAREPRERSGTRAANRFDFQMSWAFCLLIDLEAQNRDYIVVLDYHDDVVVFDSESSPTKADFYQIKTDSQKNWTLTDLLSRSEGRYSIIGKLYAHHLNFGDQAGSLNLVAVRPFSLEISPGRTAVLDQCSLGNLCDTALGKIKAALQAEHNLPELPQCDISLVLRTDPLSVKEHSIHAEGKLSRHLRDKFGDKPYHVSHAFEALITELKRRNNFEGQLNSKEAFFKNKAFGRQEFSTLIRKCARAGEREGRWRQIEQILIREQLNVFSVEKYERLWQTRELLRLDFSNSVAQLIQRTADESVKHLRDSDPAQPLLPFIGRCVQRCRDALPVNSIPITDDDLLGAVLSSITTSEL